MASIKCEFPRRQAMLSIREYRSLDDGRIDKRLEDEHATD